MTTRSYAYERWDVFTAHVFGGNPLAIVPDARGLDDATMQALTRAFNLSDTAFVLPRGRAEARARYFTPAWELPMAGHPTIGTTFALDARGVFGGDRGRLELDAGRGPVEVLSRQGVEEERPSEIHLRIRWEGGDPAVEVGGGAVRVARGVLEL